MNRTVRGALAGAAGTVALDSATYADMVPRGRAASETPAALVGALGDRLGRRANRRSGLGALLGYATGPGVGMAHGALGGRRGTATAFGGVVVGLAAMAASDVPIVALGVSDPRTWGVAGWAADVIPHLVYSLVTVATYGALTER